MSRGGSCKSRAVPCCMTALPLFFLFDRPSCTPIENRNIARSKKRSNHSEPEHYGRCFGTAYPLLFFLFWLSGCYSLCLQKHALGLHTAQKGQSVKAQSVRPMIEYKMPPQPRAHAMSRARGIALAKPTPCFSSYFGCAAAIPRVQSMPPVGGGA